MAEGKHLGAELGVGAGADQGEVDDEEDELVGEAEKHAPGTRPAAATIRGRLTCPARCLPQASLGWPYRTDATWCMAQVEVIATAIRVRPCNGTPGGLRQSRPVV